MGTPALVVDVLAEIKGVEFEAAWQRRLEIEVEPGLNVPFISVDDFIQAKLAAARDQDLLDVKAVREAEKQRALDEIANALETSGGQVQRNNEQNREH